MDRVEEAWFDRELVGCSFGDERVAQRLRKLLERMEGAMGASIPLACQDWGHQPLPQMCERSFALSIDGDGLVDLDFEREGIGESLWPPQCLAMDDIDADDDLDVVTARQRSGPPAHLGQVILHRNAGDGTFGEPESRHLAGC